MMTLQQVRGIDMKWTGKYSKGRAMRLMCLHVQNAPQ